MNPPHYESELKVLHVIPAVAQRYGGPSRAIFSMCRALQGIGVASLVATTDADGRNRLRVPLGRIVDYAGVPTIFFRREWSEAFKYSRPLATWLGDQVQDFDLVHIHAVFSHACLAAAQRCGKGAVPYIVRPLGTLDPWSLRQKRLRKQILWRLGIARMLCDASAIHYTTIEERRRAEESLGLDRGVVIPLGVEEELLGPAVDGGESADARVQGEDPYILVLARLHPKKGLDLLLQAFVELTRREMFRRWRLVLAGDGEPAYVARLKRSVGEHGAGGRVVFTGWLDGRERIATLRNAALVALPSHQENFALSVVEALACGVPVLVSTHVNLAEEICAARAGWVTSLEGDALVSTLSEALGDEDERHRRGRAGQNLVRLRFAWSSIANELVALYLALVAGKRAIRA